MESVLLVLGQVHATAYINQEEDIGEEDQVILIFSSDLGQKVSLYLIWLQFFISRTKW